MSFCKHQLFILFPMTLMGLKLEMNINRPRIKSSIYETAMKRYFRNQIEFKIHQFMSASSALLKAQKVETTIKYQANSSDII